MSTPLSPITIEVTADAAQAFVRASDEDRRKLQALLDLRLRELTTSPVRPLKEIMDEAGRRAVEQGLMPEDLKSLLQDP